MDFRLSDEEKLIKDTAAQFVNRELLSREGAYLKQKDLFLPPGDPPRRDLDPQIRQTLGERARSIGLWILELPEAVGGSPLNAVARVLVDREFGRSVLPFEPPIIPKAVASSRYAEKLCSGELTLSLVFDEIHTTGTPSRVKTRFRPVVDGFVLKSPTLDVYDPKADLFLIPAKEEGIGRVSLFVLDRQAVGLSIEETVDLTADAQAAKFTLRDCKAETHQLVGHEYEAREVVATEQLRIAGRSLGVGMRCLASSLEHASNRVTFGRPLASRQAIQWMLADLSISLRTCTWLTLEAAWKADQGSPYFDAAALAKKRSAKMAFEAADTAIQIHGGYGVCKEFPFEGFYREARMMRLLYGREGEIDRAIGEKFLSMEHGAWGREREV
ncbi:MAG TPA: acyl-CoA dehydrogenase family protein [Candidatus Binatia bacterium]|nr:acyl-CoA dehydrogenase family protein [Candidatus Binatia bacterium]